MHSKIFTHAFIMIFLILFLILFVKGNNLTRLNDPRYLEEETFGIATLRFDNTGTKILVNVNDVDKENLAFYLKKGDNLSEIPNDKLSINKATSTYTEDSEGNTYYVQKVSYNLINADEEIVLKLKKKQNSLKGLFAFS